MAAVSAQSCDSPQASLSLNGGLGAPVLESENANRPPSQERTKRQETRSQRGKRKRPSARDSKQRVRGPAAERLSPGWGLGAGEGEAWTLHEDEWGLGEVGGASVELGDRSQTAGCRMGDEV